MKDIIPLFRIDLIKEWETAREKVWGDAEKYYEKQLKKMGKTNNMVYLCSPLKPTKQKLVQDHIADAILVASQILGTQYKGKNIAVWIPHVHIFSIYNEIVYPETREKAIKFNNHLIQQYFHTLVVIGDRISEGMAAEIALAKKNRMEIVTIGDFKGNLDNLPTSQQTKASYKKMVNLHNKIHGPKFLIG